MLDPIQRRRFGIFALLLSMIFFAVAVAAWGVNAINRNSVSNEIAAASQECQNRMKILGASTVNMTDTQLTAKWANLEGGYNTVGNASAGAMACPGWRMTQFCMGAGCGSSGATMTMMKVTG